jgi:hypothetical protein
MRRKEECSSFDGYSKSLLLTILPLSCADVLFGRPGLVGDRIADLTVEVQFGVSIAVCRARLEEFEIDGGEEGRK